MKPYRLMRSALMVFLCFLTAGCSSGHTSFSSILGQALPEEITNIEMNGFYNGSELEPWDLTQEEIEELNTWLSELSLKHRTYAEGESPNEVWSGGTSYRFHINDGELSFTWSCIDNVYIIYDGEWYEITNSRTPPLGLAGSS